MSHPPSSAALFPPLPPTANPGRKLRVCIASFDFVGPIRNGGVGTAFTSLGEALAAAGHEVTFLYLSGTHCETTLPLEHWIADYRRKGIEFVPLPDRSGPRLESPWHMAKSFEAYQWLRTRSFDIVHFSEWRAPGYYTLVAKHQGLAFADTELCVHTHGPTIWSLLSNGEYLTQLIELELDYMERRSVRLADSVVSPSHYLLRWMQDQGWTLPERTYVQQYIRPASARPGSPESGERPRPVSEIVFFGRLEIRKGLVLFCDALDRLAGDPGIKDVRITFLGKLTKINDRDGAEVLADRAKAWPWAWQIVSDRDQSGALEYLQGPGRLALIPSIVDNLPNTVLECLGAGVPFLASTTGGIPEMIAPADREEILFPLRAAPLADRLRRAVREGVRPARFAVEPDANRSAWLAWHRRHPAPAPAEPSAAELPLVSICISHFNRPDYLRQALASIEAQDYPRIEVVLVDDASTRPEAVAYIDSLEPVFAARGWTLIRNPEELFVGAARNVAARRARGEFLKFMDDDNVAKPHEVSTFVRVAQRTGADVVSCALDFFSGDEPPGPGEQAKFRFLFLGAAASASALRNYYGDTNSLFRKDVFLGLGGFHEERRAGMEDWKIIGSAVLKGYVHEVIPEALVWYRRTEVGDNASSRNSLHAGHMQYIQPYLEAVPADLRALVLYAQGMSMKGEGPAVELWPYAQLTIKWKSKLEAGLAVAALGQPAAAAKLMVDGVKAVQSCGVPRVVLEALLEIGAKLGPLDPGRARYLLGLAAKLAESHHRTREVERARRLIIELTPAPTAPVPELAEV
jgi:glycosyltransferase involved in cell wall biosynthesis/GT2 family glycosyltransferase